jgi:glucosylglycerate synthase
MDAARLPHDVEQRLAEIGAADLVIGVFSYEQAQARTIVPVLQGAEKGVRAHFPEARGVVVHAYPGSSDGTPEAAAGALAELPVCSLPYGEAAATHGVPSRARMPGADQAFRLLCLAARRVDARAVLLLRAELRELPEDSVGRLLRPVWDDELDLVTPLFTRPVLDGTLTSCLLYPLTRALYGTAVRQSVAAEVALSRSLLERLCDAAVVGGLATRSLSLFMTTTATATAMRLGEAWLGARAEEPRETRLDLAQIVSEVAGGAFALAELYEEQWREALPRPPPRLTGTASVVRSDPLPASQARMVGVFQQGLRDLEPIWEQALATTTLADLYPLGDLPPEEFVFSAELWARVVYDFMLAYRFRVLHREHLLRSLVPLYLGRLAGLWREAAGRTGPVQERLLEVQARAFEEAKPSLVDRWR